MLEAIAQVTQEHLEFFRAWRVMEMDPNTLFSDLPDAEYRSFEVTDADLACFKPRGVDGGSRRDVGVRWWGKQVWRGQRPCQIRPLNTGEVAAKVRIGVWSQEQCPWIFHLLK